jgi:hypothetical protein
MDRVRSGVSRVRTRVACASLLAFLWLAAPHAPALESEANAAEPQPAAVAEASATSGPPMPLAPRVVPSPFAAREWRGAWALDASLFGAGQLADLVSTEYALTRPALREGNPLLGSRGVRIPAKLAVAALGAWATHRIRKRGHHGRARALAVVGFAIGAGFAVHNVRMARQHR